MQTLPNAIKLVLTSILALTFTLAELGKDVLKEPLEELMGNEDYATAATVVIVFAVVWILILVLQEILPWYVQRNAWLRRLLLREDFIEGTWKDVVFPEGNATQATGGIVNITYEDGGLKISGESFDANGKPIGNFNSLVAHYGEKRLVYCFSKNVSLSGEPPVSPGYCDYRFGGAGRYPDSFFGYFFKEDDHAKYRVYGFRLTKADERNVARGPEAKGAVVQELIAERIAAAAQRA